MHIFSNRETETWVSVNLKKHYDEKVVIIVGGGGGIPTLILNHMKFKHIVTFIYSQRLNMLPFNFTGVHIRNTDRSTDVQLFLETHKNLSENSSFLATDDVNTVKLFDEVFQQKVFHLSIIPNSTHSKKAIHYSHGNFDQETFIVDCITDILLLSSGVELYTPCIKSGYGKLAQYLFRNKDLLYNITHNE
jgi:hypothetical protein